MMLICLTTDDVNLDYLVKVVSARFFYKVTSYSFAVNRCLGRDTLNLCKYPVFFLYFSNSLLLATAVTVMFPNGDFFVSLSFCIYSSE